jgi:hypothetical protein
MYWASIRALNISFNKVKFWTDSVGTTCLVKVSCSKMEDFCSKSSEPHTRDIYVEYWNHISSKENPADLVSCGVNANVLRNLSSWRNSPNWLRLEETSWPKCEDIADIIEEKKTVNHPPIVSLLTQRSQEEVFIKFSSWNKLQRVTAYCLRFIHNCHHKNSCFQGASSLSELNEATLMCVKEPKLTAS